VAEEECGSAVVNEMAPEPYFVDFLREPPEPTGIYTWCNHRNISHLQIMALF
jgi:hypothetical protein